MKLHFFPSESVRVCIPAQPPGSSQPEIQIAGRVAVAEDNVLSIILSDPAPQSSNLLLPPTRFIVRKTTPFGILEFDATGRSHWVDDALTLQVKLLGTHRSIQRRASFRIELRSEVRYRDLAGSCADWQTAELNDISLGGASLLAKGNAVQIGHELQLEFSLNRSTFSTSGTVRRIELSKRGQTHLYALEFLTVDVRQQEHMAREMTQLQLRIINSHVNDR